MNLASIRLVTGDVDRLAQFYAMLTGVAATRPAPAFAEIHVDGAILAISSEGAIKQFNANAAVAGANRSAIIEFRVEDVDAVRDCLRGEAIDLVMEPTTQPWGNRSMLLRDPDGNLINIFAPPARKA